MACHVDVLCRHERAGERVSKRDNGGEAKRVKGGERKAWREGTGQVKGVHAQGRGRVQHREREIVHATEKAREGRRGHTTGGERKGSVNGILYARDSKYLNISYTRFIMVCYKFNWFHLLTVFFPN